MKLELEKKGVLQMIYTLKSDALEIQVSTMGAELQSIKGSDGYEYLWQGNPEYWNGRSPILFPIVGGVPDGKYSWKGQTYEMASHGFARKTEFTLAKQTEDTLEFKLSDSEKTHSQYPFAFDFYVIYTLHGNTVSEGYRVVNKNADVMPFSVGGHPAFNCPMDEGKDYGDYTVTFEKPETAVRYLKANKALTGETLPFLDNESKKQLSHEMFYKDAVVLKSIQSSWAELSAGGRSIRVDFAGFPDFGIWSSANDGPFVCLEPWYGTDSFQSDSGKLEEKYGIVFLPAGETFEATFYMTMKA